jgi:hypothetical protein
MDEASNGSELRGIYGRGKRARVVTGRGEEGVREAGSERRGGAVVVLFGDWENASLCSETERRRVLWTRMKKLTGGGGREGGRERDQCRREDICVFSTFLLT